MAPAALTEHVDELRVLVTGGSGFLGAHTVARLLDEGAAQVAVVSRKPKPLDVDRVSYHAADIGDAAQVQAVFALVKPHAVVHTAAPHHTDAAATHQRVTVEGTCVLLACAKDCPETRAFIYTSSDSACVPTQTPLAEQDAQLYTAQHYPNPYALSKALADAATLAANAPNQLATAVLRVPALYGERDTNMIPQLLASVRKNEHRIQVGPNKKVFEFLYIRSAAEAHVLALRALLDPTHAYVAGEAFFVSDGRPQPFFDFARRCYAAAGSPVDPANVSVIPLAALQAAASAGEWAYYIFTLGTKQPTLRRDSIDHLDRGVCWSLDKAKRALGYEPVADQDAAIQRTMDWAVSSL